MYQHVDKEADFPAHKGCPLVPATIRQVIYLYVD
jgi:hypothetical protein